MSNIVKQHEPRLPALQMDEQELMQVLQSSLYPGASPASIKMALGYCKAAGLDPMQKPVHIVPMWDSKAGSMRDVVMPGVGLYRTQAARSGECAGVSEPDFGPDTTETLGGQSITFPAWCRVTVKRRLPTGEVVEFTAKEFWKENYAIKGGKEKSIAPNAMWTKRPYGQLAKCAEAQALRKAFPEVGSQPTADEMEGKTLDAGEVQMVPPAAPPKFYDATKFDHNLPKWAETIQQGRKSAKDYIDFAATRGEPFTEEQKARLLSVKAAPPADEVQDVQPKAEAAPAVTYADLAGRLRNAQSPDELDEAATLIGAVENPQHRAELTAIYNDAQDAFA
jgi:phage recombination protein Bet